MQANVSRLDILRSFLPLDVLSNDATNSAVLLHYEQQSTMQPALYALSVFVSTLANKPTVYDASVLRIYLLDKYPPRSDDTFSRIYDIAQRLQVGQRLHATPAQTMCMAGRGHARCQA